MYSWCLKYLSSELSLWFILTSVWILNTILCSTINILSWNISFFSFLYLLLCDQTFIYSFLRKYRNMIINLLPLWVNLSFSFFLFKLKTDSSYIPTKDFSSSTPSIQTSLSLTFVSAPSSSPLEQVPRDNNQNANTQQNHIQ